MPTLHQINIYLVDNEPIVTKTLQEFLNNLGYTVNSLNSINGLLDIFKKEPKTIRLVIVDINIFRKNEAAIMCEVHQQYPDTYFVIVTDSPPNLSTEEAINYGVYGYLHKPIYLTELELLLIRLAERCFNHEYVNKKMNAT